MDSFLATKQVISRSSAPTLGSKASYFLIIFYFLSRKANVSVEECPGVDGKWFSALWEPLQMAASGTGRSLTTPVIGWVVRPTLLSQCTRQLSILTCLDREAENQKFFPSSTAMTALMALGSSTCTWALLTWNPLSPMDFDVCALGRKAKSTKWTNSAKSNASSLNRSCPGGCFMPWRRQWLSLDNISDFCSIRATFFSSFWLSKQHQVASCCSVLACNTGKEQWWLRALARRAEHLL